MQLGKNSSKPECQPTFSKMKRGEYIVRIVLAAVFALLTLVGILFFISGQELFGISSQKISDATIPLAIYFATAIQRWERIWVLIVNLVLVALALCFLALAAQGTCAMRFWDICYFLSVVLAAVLPVILGGNTILLWEKIKDPVRSNQVTEPSGRSCRVWLLIVLGVLLVRRRSTTAGNQGRASR